MALTPQVESAIQKVAARKNIPYEYLKNQVLHESSGNPKARGDIGAKNGESRGLLQIQEQTALGVLKVPKDQLNRLFEPEYNLDKGTDYLLYVQRQIPNLPSDNANKWAITFSAYNSGPAYMIKALKRLSAKGVKGPSANQAFEEMQLPDFGKKPLLGINMDYVKKIVSNIDLKKTAMVGGSILAGAAFYFFIIAPKGKLG
jgi:membrane-bound lytic murein transglycosylase MltF